METDSEVSIHRLTPVSRIVTEAPAHNSNNTPAQPANDADSNNSFTVLGTLTYMGTLSRGASLENVFTDQDRRNSVGVDMGVQVGDSIMETSPVRRSSAGQQNDMAAQVGDSLLNPVHSQYQSQSQRDFQSQCSLEPLEENNDVGARNTQQASRPKRKSTGAIDKRRTSAESAESNRSTRRSSRRSSLKETSFNIDDGDGCLDQITDTQGQRMETSGDMTSSGGSKPAKSQTNRPSDSSSNRDSQNLKQKDNRTVKETTVDKEPDLSQESDLVSDVGDYAERVDLSYSESVDSEMATNSPCQESQVSSSDAVPIPENPQFTETHSRKNGKEAEPSMSPRVCLVKLDGAPRRSAKESPVAKHLEPARRSPRQKCLVPDGKKDNPLEKVQDSPRSSTLLKNVLIVNQQANSLDLQQEASRSSPRLKGQSPEVLDPPRIRVDKVKDTPPHITIQDILEDSPTVSRSSPRLRSHSTSESNTSCSGKEQEVSRSSPRLQGKPPEIIDGVPPRKNVHKVSDNPPHITIQDILEDSPTVSRSSPRLRSHSTSESDASFSGKETHVQNQNIQEFDSRRSPRLNVQGTASSSDLGASPRLQNRNAKDKNSSRSSPRSLNKTTDSLTDLRRPTRFTDERRNSTSDARSSPRSKTKITESMTDTRSSPRFTDVRKTNATDSRSSPRSVSRITENSDDVRSSPRYMHVRRNSTPSARSSPRSINKVTETSVDTGGSSKSTDLEKTNETGSRSSHSVKKTTENMTDVRNSPQLMDVRRNSTPNARSSPRSINKVTEMSVETGGSNRFMDVEKTNEIEVRSSPRSVNRITESSDNVRSSPRYMDVRKNSMPNARSSPRSINKVTETLPDTRNSPRLSNRSAVISTDSSRLPRPANKSAENLPDSSRLLPPPKHSAERLLESRSSPRLVNKSGEIVGDSGRLLHPTYQSAEKLMESRRSPHLTNTDAENFTDSRRSPRFSHHDTEKVANRSLSKRAHPTSPLPEEDDIVLPTPPKMRRLLRPSVPGSSRGLLGMERGRSIEHIETTENSDYNSALIVGAVLEKRGTSVQSPQHSETSYSTSNKTKRSEFEDYAEKSSPESRSTSRASMSSLPKALSVSQASDSPSKTPQKTSLEREDGIETRSSFSPSSVVTARRPLRSESYPSPKAADEQPVVAPKSSPDKPEGMSPAIPSTPDIVTTEDWTTSTGSHTEPHHTRQGTSNSVKMTQKQKKGSPKVVLRRLDSQNREKTPETRSTGQFPCHSTQISPGASEEPPPPLDLDISPVLRGTQAASKLSSDSRERRRTRSSGPSGKFTQNQSLAEQRPTSPMNESDAHSEVEESVSPLERRQTRSLGSSEDLKQDHSKLNALTMSPRRDSSSDSNVAEPDSPTFERRQTRSFGSAENLMQDLSKPSPQAPLRKDSDSESDAEDVITSSIERRQTRSIGSSKDVGQNQSKTHETLFSPRTGYTSESDAAFVSPILERSQTRRVGSSDNLRKKLSGTKTLPASPMNDSYSQSDGEELVPPSHERRRTKSFGSSENFMQVRGKMNSSQSEVEKSPHVVLKRIALEPEFRFIGASSSRNVHSAQKSTSVTSTSRATDMPPVGQNEHSVDRPEDPNESELSLVLEDSPPPSPNRFSPPSPAVVIQRIDSTGDWLRRSTQLSPSGSIKPAHITLNLSPIQLGTTQKEAESEPVTRKPLRSLSLKPAGKPKPASPPKEHVENKGKSSDDVVPRVVLERVDADPERFRKLKYSSKESDSDSGSRLRLPRHSSSSSRITDLSRNVASGVIGSKSNTSIRSPIRRVRHKVSSARIARQMSSSSGDEARGSHHRIYSQLALNVMHREGSPPMNRSRPIRLQTKETRYSDCEIIGDSGSESSCALPDKTKPRKTDVSHKKRQQQKKNTSSHTEDYMEDGDVIISSTEDEEIQRRPVRTRSQLVRYTDTEDTDSEGIIVIEDAPQSPVATSLLQLIEQNRSFEESLHSMSDAGGEILGEESSDEELSGPKDKYVPNREKQRSRRKPNQVTKVSDMESDVGMSPTRQWKGDRKVYSATKTQSAQKKKRGETTEREDSKRKRRVHTENTEMEYSEDVVEQHEENDGEDSADESDEEVHFNKTPRGKRKQTSNILEPPTASDSESDVSSKSDQKDRGKLREETPHRPERRRKKYDESDDEYVPPGFDRKVYSATKTQSAQKKKRGETTEREDSKRKRRVHTENTEMEYSEDVVEQHEENDREDSADESDEEVHFNKTPRGKRKQTSKILEPSTQSDSDSDVSSKSDKKGRGKLRGETPHRPERRRKKHEESDDEYVPPGFDKTPVGRVRHLSSVSSNSDSDFRSPPGKNRRRALRAQGRNVKKATTETKTPKQSKDKKGESESPLLDSFLDATAGPRNRGKKVKKQKCLLSKETGRIEIIDENTVSHDVNVLFGASAKKSTLNTTSARKRKLFSDRQMLGDPMLEIPEESPQLEEESSGGKTPLRPIPSAKRRLHGLCQNTEKQIPAAKETNSLTPKERETRRSLSKDVDTPQLQANDGNEPGQSMSPSDMGSPKGLRSRRSVETPVNSLPPYQLPAQRTPHQEASNGQSVNLDKIKVSLHEYVFLMLSVCKYKL